MEEKSLMTTNNPQDKKPNTDQSPLQQFVDHQRKAAEETVKAVQALIPPDFRAHSRQAREEFLNSFKVLIEGAAEAVDRELKKAQSARAEAEAQAAQAKQSTDDSANRSTTTGKTKVKVEVS